MSDVPLHPEAGPESKAPGRPPTVDPAAVWSEETGEWELVGKDEAGRPHGAARSWRADGTLASQGEYRGGLRQGVHRRFHPDGTVALEGTYLDGLADGDIVARGSDAPTTERLQPCCVPPGAWERRVAYDRGTPVGDRWFDRSGAQILPSGRPHPVRPEAVPPEALYDEDTERWIRVERGVTADDGKGIEVWWRWATGGALRERTELAGTTLHGRSQSFDAAGALAEEITYRDGRRDGPYRRIGVPPGTYQNERVQEERGQYAADQAVGSWTVHDGDGEVLRRFNLGPPLDEERLRSGLRDLAGRFAADGGAAAVLGRDLEGFEREGRTGEGLLAAACLSGVRGEPDPLRLALASATPALTPPAAEELAAQAIDNAAGNLVPLVNALLRGGAPASLLRALASALAGAEPVALALLDGALALSPERGELWSSRALVNIYLGRPAVARADVSRLPPEWAEQRAFLELYTRVVFPRFDFWPARLEIRTVHDGLPPAPEQPLEAIRTVIQKYATRLAEIRAQVSALATSAGGLADAEWLPPDVSPLLPEGPVALDRWEFEETVVDETAPDGESPPPTLVRVDERRVVEDGATIPALMRRARAEWNALCWLCWSAGLDRVALPEKVAPPSLFGAALGMFVERVWRCRDKLTTSGLRALTQGVPGFVWEGVEIDFLPRALAEIAADEHVEVRALFYWLADAGVQSPWQDNLRGE